MERIAVPIDAWLTNADAAGGPLSSLPTRLLAGADRTVPAGRRSVSVMVNAKAGDTSPVFNTPTGSSVLPEGAQVVLSCDYPADTLPQITITTVPGDDVLVTETWAT